MIVYAIPTYKRYQVVKDKTLSVLKRNKVSIKDIYVFVANKSEKMLYQNSLGNDYNLIVGVVGIDKQRNYISNYFPVGHKIVLLDDDITEITQLGNKKLNPIKDFKLFVKDAFAECEEHNLYMWGVYPVDNHYFMKNVITYDLRYIVGVLYGIINRHSKDLKLWVAEKEDFLKTLQYFVKDGGVVRYNYIGIKTKYYAEGGLRHDRDRVALGFKAVKEIHKLYPKLTRIQEPTDTNKHYEIKLLK
tara:strand:+ start:510 stop:1244 length:735 start_codon:yes stop_codon:yes gene_type:complete